MVPANMVISVATIPPFSLSGVLPPYVGNPTGRSQMAPFSASILDVVDRFGSSQPRLQLLDGLLRYRLALAAIGLVEGLQWLDGSFAENIESIEARDPRDIDVVTFFRRPQHVRDHATWLPFVLANATLFDPGVVKAMFHCDAYVVDLDVGNPFSVVESTRYWFGLFSHRRISNLWKGLVQVPLAPSPADAHALTLLAQRRIQP